MFLFIRKISWLLLYECVLCNLGSFEITEWKPINFGAVWFNFFESFKNDKCRSCQFL